MAMNPAIGTRARMSSDDRRRQLTQTALAVIAAGGIRELSLDEVADRAGVTRNLLYHYFPRGQLDLELAAVNEAALQLSEGFDTDPAVPLDEKLPRNFDVFVRHAWQQTDAWRTMVDAASRRDEEMRAKVDAHRDVVVAAIALNHFGTEDPGPLAHTALRGFLEFAFTALDLGRKANLDPEAVVATLRDVLLATVASVRPG